MWILQSHMHKLTVSNNDGLSSLSCCSGNSQQPQCSLPARTCCRSLPFFPAAVLGADPIAACHRPWQQLRQQVEGGTPAQLVAGLSLWACLAAVLQGVLLEPEHGELDDAALQAHLNFAQVGTGNASCTTSNACATCHIREDRHAKPSSQPC